MKRVKTRIIATLGPASSTPAVLRKMIKNGLDVVRLNFSHGRPEEHRARIRLIHDMNRRMKRRIRILADLEGPRIRIGDLPDKGVMLDRGAAVRLVRASASRRAGALPVDFTGSFLPMKKASDIFIDDGTIRIEIRGAGRDYVEGVVRAGGRVTRHKGVNIPEARLAFPRLSPEDAENIALVGEEGVDYIAQSFVQSSDEVEAVRRLAPRGAAIIAKIENREGFENADAILDAADGIMVARGDLGVSLPVWDVPFLQKELIRAARRRRKPVITATQMLESMTANRRPTRAEVSDVANAVLDGTDFVMLSAETAVGAYPAETVAMMNRILMRAEEYLSAR